MKTKFTCAILAGILAYSSFATLSYTPIEAISENTNSEIFIETSAVPQAVNEYAKAYFSEMFSKLDISIFGLDTSHKNTYALASGFQMQGNADEQSVFHFPIMQKGLVCAMLTIIQTPDGYQAQFGKSDLGDELNILQKFTTKDNPVILYSFDEGYVAVTQESNEAYILETFDSQNENTMTRSLVNTTDNVLVTKALMTNQNIDNKNLSNISTNDTIIDVLDIENQELSMTSRYTPTSSSQVCIDYWYPHMRNVTYTNSNREAQGTCWAANIRSILAYYGYSYTHNSIVQRLFPSANANTLQLGGAGNGATNAQVASYIRSLSGNTLSTTSYITYNLSDSDIITAASSKSPIFTSWINTANNNGHSVTVTGYGYHTNNQNAIDYLFIADPNQYDRVTTYGRDSGGKFQYYYANSRLYKQKGAVFISKN